MDEPTPKTIRQRADECRAEIEALEAQKVTTATRGERSVINKRIRMMQELEDWFRSRRGYE